MHRYFPGFCAALSVFTRRTDRSRSLGASIDAARKAYSREIDMQARRKTKRTDSAGVGIVGFISRLLVDAPDANRVVCTADSPVMGGAARRAHHQA